jgi:phage virion morphogenesis protein
MTGTGASFRVEVNDAEVAAALRQLQDRGGDLAPALDEIGAMLVTSTQIRFERGIGPDGIAWPASLRAKLEGGQTLVDSARLKDSITHVVSGDAVAVGTNVIYAAVHQLGATINAKGGGHLTFMVGGRFVSKKSVTIPARPFLGVDADDEAEILNILGDYLAGDLPVRPA